MPEQPIGEILEASSTLFVAAAYRLMGAPPFGALVRAGTPGGCLAYGLVCEIHTVIQELNGRAVVRGRDGLYDAAIYAANPDLETVLQTEFRALIVGYCEGATIRQHLPPWPPAIHYSVHLCPDDELRRFTAQLDFLPTVLNATDLPADEVLAAALRRAAAVHADPRAFLVQVGQRLALLLRDDHPRLMTVLQRLRW